MATDQRTKQRLVRILDLTCDNWPDNEPGGRVFLKAVIDMGERFPDMAWKERDAIFEKENRCKVGYDAECKARFVVFDDNNWSWFLIKWS